MCASPLQQRCAHAAFIFISAQLDGIDPDEHYDDQDERLLSKDCNGDEKSFICDIRSDEYG